MKKETRIKILSDPVLFSEVLLKDDLWGKQKEILKAAADDEINTIAIKSANSTGKTFAISRLALWFLIRHRNSRVILTANTHIQLLNITFKEVLNGFEKIKNHLGAIRGIDSHHSTKSMIELDTK